MYIRQKVSAYNTMTLHSHILVYVVGSGECTCSVLCASHLTSNGPPGYYYDGVGGCVQLTANCTVNSGECVYENQSACESVCLPCPQGSNRDASGHCCEFTHTIQLSPLYLVQCNNVCSSTICDRM